MNLLSFLENLPSAIYGIIIGSLLTIIGVILTNASNTRRLRLQHDHERKLEDKARDLNLRRDVYMQAMEAIAAGLVAIGRVSELDSSMDDLMRSYTDLSPKIGKVSIVGNNETIKAMANFQQELTGAFLRLSSKREKFKTLFQQAETIELELKQMEKDQTHIWAMLEKQQNGNSSDFDEADLEKQHQTISEQITLKRKGFDAIWEKIFPLQLQLVQDSFSEVADLDILLVPLVGMMRTELELPFNQEFYRAIIEEGHKKQKQYLDAFFNDFGKDL